MYKVTVDKHEPFKIDATQLPDWDVIKLKENRYHIIHNNQSLTAEIVEVDEVSKTMKISLNGKLHQVTLQDKMDLLLEKLGMSDALIQKINDLKAPMPGLVLDIKVNVGDTVEKGQVIAVLEAMKMENNLKAAGEGTVKNIEVNIGDAVEKGQVLIVFE